LKESCVPIIGTVFAALVLCLVGHYSATIVDWTRTKDFVEVFANISQSFALIAGGVWAYFKFAKGRTFRERLTPTVSGRVVAMDGSVFLVVTTMLHNVGLSRIAFDQEESSLVVFEYLPSKAEEIVSLKNKWLAVFQVFGDKDRYIESNEIVERQCLIALPQVSNIGYQLEVEVVTNSGFAWRATTIVDSSAFEDNEVG
jgi:hypothetical protein